MNRIEYYINLYSPVVNELRSQLGRYLDKLIVRIQNLLKRLLPSFFAQPRPVQSLENRVTIHSCSTVLSNEELLSIILDFSTSSDAINMTRVCRRTYEISSGNNLIRKAIINVCLEFSFLPKDWSNFGTIAPFPSSSSIPDDIRAVLDSNCPFNPGKIIAQTHVLLFTPDLVNGQPLTLNSFRVLMEHPINGLPTCFRRIWGQITQDHGNTPLRTIGQSGYVLITKDVIPGSRSQRYAAQQALITQHGEAAYKPPSLLEMIVLLTAVHNKKGIRLYSDNLLTYTRCQEQSDGWRLAVGGFAPAGLYVYNFNGFGNEDIGVGARRKF